MTTAALKKTTQIGGGTIFGILLMAGALTAAIIYWGGEHQTNTKRLERFLSVYANQCDPSAFVIATPARNAYLRSATLQQEVHRQLDAIESGASCAEVHRALRGVDFPVPVLPKIAR